MTEGASSQLVVQEYLRVLRRRKWIVLGLVVLCVSVALGFSLSRPKIYRASAELLLQRRSTENLFDAVQDIRAPGGVVENEMKVIESQPVRDKARERLGFVPSISTQQSGATDVIVVSAEHAVPQQAADIANAYTEEYLEYRRTRAIDEILAASEQIQRRIDVLQEEINALDGQLRDPAVDPTSAIASVTAAKSQALINQQNTFKQKLNELEVDEALNTGGAQLVNSATTPISPVRPNPVTDGILAGSVGLVLGIALAFLREYLDDSITTKEHLDLASGSDVSVLGLIPAIDRGDRGAGGVEAIVDPASHAAEAYRALRTSVQFLGVDQAQVIQVTSANRSEGKTTTAVNLATVFARTGKRTLLVDCDLRRAQVHEIFDFPNVGFTSVLLGDVGLSAALQKAPGSELHVLCSGPRPPNPSELLSSVRTQELLNGLRSIADVVIVDSPPLLPVTDGSVLARSVDAVLLVVMAGSTGRRSFQRALELMRQVQVPAIGTVLNRASEEAHYGYEYSYTYEPDEAKVSRRARRKEAARASSNGAGIAGNGFGKDEAEAAKRTAKG